MLKLGKRFENRKDSRGIVPAVCRHVGPVLLHASGGMTRRELCGAIDAWQDDERITASQHIALVRAKLPLGGIVGYARAIGRVDPEGWFHGPCRLGRERWVDDDGWIRDDVAERFDLRWWAGSDGLVAGGHALVLDDVHELPFVKCPGRLGLWRPPADVLRRLEQAGRRFDRCGNLLYRSPVGWVTVPS
jgi:hypothetical protein